MLEVMSIVVLAKKGGKKVEKLTTLNYKMLVRQSSLTTVGCPFSTPYEGSVYNMNLSRSSRESQCVLCCGEMFRREYQRGRCPCWHLDKDYIKKVFWNKLHEAQRNLTWPSSK